MKYNSNLAASNSVNFFAQKNKSTKFNIVILTLDLFNLSQSFSKCVKPQTSKEFKEYRITNSAAKKFPIFLMDV